MRTAHPQHRLRDIPIGQHVKLADLTDHTFTVAAVRDDGYIELTLNGRPVVIASPGHLITESK